MLCQGQWFLWRENDTQWITKWNTLHFPCFESCQTTFFFFFLLHGSRKEASQIRMKWEDELAILTGERFDTGLRKSNHRTKNVLRLCWKITIKWTARNIPPLKCFNFSQKMTLKCEHITWMSSLITVSYYGYCRPRWSQGNVLASRSKVCGFKPNWGQWIFFKT